MDNGQAGPSRNEMMKRLSEIQKENKAMQKSIVSKQGKIKNIAEVKDDYVKKLNEMEKQHNAKMFAAMREVRRLVKDNCRINREIKVRQEAKKTEQAQMTVHRTAEELQSKIQVLTKELEDVKNEKEALMFRKGAIEMGSQQTKKIIGEMESEFAMAHEAGKTLMLQVSEMEEKQNEMTSGLEGLEKEMQAVREKKTRKKARRTEIYEEMKVMTEELDRKCDSVVQQREEWLRTKAEFQRLENARENEKEVLRLLDYYDMAVMQRKITDAKTRIAGLQSQQRNSKETRRNLPKFKTL